MPETRSIADCRDVPAKVAPVVDRNCCEGSADCVRVCPFDVFGIRKLSDAERASLSWRGRLKAWAHGGHQAYVLRGADCHACRRCIEVCPEHALELQPYSG